MPTDHHPALEQLLGTVGGAMTTPVLVLDVGTQADVATRQLALGWPGRWCGTADGWSAW